MAESIMEDKLLGETGRGPRNLIAARGFHDARADAAKDLLNGEPRLAEGLVQVFGEESVIGGDFAGRGGESNVGATGRVHGGKSAGSEVSLEGAERVIATGVEDQDVDTRSFAFEQFDETAYGISGALGVIAGLGGKVDGHEIVFSAELDTVACIVEKNDITGFDSVEECRNFAFKTLIRNVGEGCDLKVERAKDASDARGVGARVAERGGGVVIVADDECQAAIR
jgi:hypothetical protein